jgi:hypothetical protein
VPAARATDGVEDLVSVLADLGLSATATRSTIGSRALDAVLRVGKTRLGVEVVRDVRDADARLLVDQLPAPSLVVADRFSPAARELLSQHGIGWLDRRGHLRLVLPPGIFIDKDIDPLIVGARNRAANPFSSVGLDVAVALLLDPTGRPGVREVARRTGASAGRVSELLREMRRQALVEGDGTPAIPDLFEAVAAAWAPRWVALSAAPRPDAGVRLAGLAAARWHGVGLAATTSSLPQFYLRDESALRRLVRNVEPDPARSVVVARAAVCPSPFGFDQAAGSSSGFAVANHVVVALDLVRDGSGRQALAGWNPTAGVRVW